MALKKTKTLHYLRFLYLMRTVKESMQTNADPIEEQMLNLLGALWYEGKKVTVLEAMALLPDISATTLHRRLKTLRTKGFISMDMDELDNRVKYVVPTPMASEYFSKLGKSLEEAGNEFAQINLRVKV
jgi:DNA-binding MarR family transcriptional regulator